MDRSTFRIENHCHYFILFGILLITAVSFWPCLKNDFVNWDDSAYLLDNDAIRSLSPENLGRIFTSYVVGNYQPLTIFSFAIEYHFVHLQPQWYHLTNLVIHFLNIALVFYFIFFLSKNRFIALSTAFLFAIHPMRVESVAWVTERKDVLFCFFYLLSLIFYLKFMVRKLSHLDRWLWASLMSFFFAVLAKPAAVSLPFVLLLLDYTHARLDIKKVFQEKIPFFLISFVFGLVAVLGTYTPGGHHYPGLAQFFWIDRLFLGCYALLSYIPKLFWPFHLSSFYPYPEKMNGLLPVAFYFSPIILFMVMEVSRRSFRKERQILFGLLFFVTTIIFNLPFLSVGLTLVADRFSYLPFLGLFYVVMTFFWKLKQQTAPTVMLKIVMVAFFMVLIFIFGTHTYKRCLVWKNGETLWSDVIEKTPSLALAYYSRADYFFKKGDLSMAIQDYSQAIKLLPAYYFAYNERGNMFFLTGRTDLALADYTQAVRLNPRYIEAYLNRGSYYEYHEKLNYALANYEMILDIDPEQKEALKRKRNILEKWDGK